MQDSGALYCHGVSLDIRSSVRICDANHMSCVTGPVTQKLQGPSTAKDFRNYKCSYGVLVPEYFSAILNDSNFFPPPFNSACQPGTSIEGSWKLLEPQTSALSFCQTRCGTGKSPWVLQCTVLLPHPR